MPQYIDIKGQRFGLLTVVSREQSKNEKAMWLCQCDCGNTVVARGSSLRDGHTKSCGCLKLNDLDLTGEQFGKLTVVLRAPKGTDRHSRWNCICECGKSAIYNTTSLISGNAKSCGCSQHPRNHDLEDTRLYIVWKGMKQRCYNPSSKSYKYYGGRGIEICEEWRNNFTNFCEWAYLHGYNKDAKFGECTIERINVNGNYEPSNCKWITHHEQTLNRRDTLYIKFTDTGETFKLYDFCLSSKLN
jgi:hypothetical protein